MACDMACSLNFIRFLRVIITPNTPSVTDGVRDLSEISRGGGGVGILNLGSKMR